MVVMQDKKCHPTLYRLSTEGKGKVKAQRATYPLLGDQDQGIKTELASRRYNTPGNACTLPHTQLSNQMNLTDSGGTWLLRIQ